MNTRFGHRELPGCGVILTLVLAALLGGTTPLKGQDTRLQWKQAAERIIRAGSHDPETYQFQHVWKARVRAVRAARARLERPGLSLSAGEMAQAGAALTGTFSYPVIAGAFTDVPAPYTQAEYQARLFGDGSGAVSVRELYEEMSQGLFSVNGGVTPWAALPQDRAYYEPSPSTDERYGRVYEFLTDALDAVDAAVDFSLFDNDGPDGIPNSGDDDGIVDLSAFIFPTVDKACGGTGIWPHMYHYFWAKYDATGVGDWYYTDDPSAAWDGPVVVGDYTIQSGLNCDGLSIMGAGTMSHELGHALDLPDLYDVDPDDGTNSYGIGYWGLMAAGNYNRWDSPAHLSAWSKDFLGWLNVETVSSSQNGVFLSPIQQAGSIMRVDLPASNEHLLFSNRQAQGSDLYLKGTGLLIWHVDRDLAGGVSEVGNGVNNDANHKGVDLEEADGQDDLDWSRNAGDAGDPFPGSWNSTEFHARTYPSSLSYAGVRCGVGIRNISEAAGSVTFDLTVGEWWALWGDANGSGTVTTSDITPIYWYYLGYRDADEQGAVPNGDVDGDGDVDLMDGFLLDSSLSGVAVPGTRIGQSMWTTCDPFQAPGFPSSAEPVSRGAGGVKGSQR